MNISGHASIVNLKPTAAIAATAGPVSAPYFSMDFEGKKIAVYDIPGVGFGIAYKRLAYALELPGSHKTVAMLMTRENLKPYALNANLAGVRRDSSIFRAVMGDGVTLACKAVGSDLAMRFAMAFSEACRAFRRAHPTGLASSTHTAPPPPPLIPPRAAHFAPPVEVRPAAARPEPARQVAQLPIPLPAAKPDPVAELLKVLPTLSPEAQTRAVELLLGSERARA